VLFNKEGNRTLSLSFPDVYLNPFVWPSRDIQNLLHMNTFRDVFMWSSCMQMNWHVSTSNTFAMIF